MMRCLLLLPLVAAAPALAAPPETATDLPVTAALVGAVAPEGAPAPVVLTDGAEDPLSATLRPDRAPALEGAGLVVVMGSDIAPWLGDVAELIAPRLLDLSQVAGVEIYGGDEAGGVTPYPWLAPGNATVWLDAIAGRMAEMDPGNAETYDSSAGLAAAAVNAAEEEVLAAILSQSGRPILAVTEAWAPFAQAFGVEIAGYTGIAGEGPRAATAESSFEAAVDRADPACILAAPTDDLSAAQAIADERRLEIFTVDPFGEAGRGIEGYTAILSDLAATLESCVQP